MGLFLVVTMGVIVSLRQNTSITTRISPEMDGVAQYFVTGSAHPSDRNLSALIINGGCAGIALECVEGVEHSGQ